MSNSTEKRSKLPDSQIVKTLKFSVGFIVAYLIIRFGLACIFNLTYSLLHGKISN